MKVEFEFEDKNGLIAMENNKTVEMDTSQITALINANIIIYPYKLGDVTAVKKGTIEEMEYNMFKNEHYLKIKLKEK